MVKVMVLLRRRADVTPENFRRHLDEIHLPLVSRLPGLQRVAVNHVVAAADGGVPPYDAIVEDWFSTPEVVQEAFAGPEGRAVGADVQNFLDPKALGVLVVTESEVRLAEPAGADDRAG